MIRPLDVCCTVPVRLCHHLGDKDTVTKLLYIIASVLLLSAAIVGEFCWIGWPPRAIDDGIAADICGLGDSHGAGGRQNPLGQEIVSPLVVQATAFAQYLKPPETAAPKTLPRAQAPAPQPVQRPPAVAPKVTLLSTSYYRAAPEKSLALVAEPGKGAYWIGKGDRVGHLVVERIVDGGIVYRDGARLQEVTIAVKNAPPLAQLKTDESVALQNVGTVVGPVNAARANARGIQMSDVHATRDGVIE